MPDSSNMFPPPQDWHAPPEIVLRHEGAVQKIYIGCLPDGSRVLDITRDGACVFNAVLPAQAAEAIADLLWGDAGHAHELREAARAEDIRAKATEALAAQLDADRTALA